MGKKKKKPKKKVDPNSATICTNRKAKREYDLLEQLECGIELCGSEVKSIRAGNVSIGEAYGRVEDGQLWLMNVDIGEYAQANVMNHDPRRMRRLLLHRREIRKFAEASAEKGLTLVPLSMYFTRGLVKVKMAIGRGRREYDKRQKLRKEHDRREMSEIKRP
jgi:SsrA-binding protein